nr:MAG TPA: hypothetical protein [Caudoviricetes sp.]
MVIKVQLAILVVQLVRDSLKVAQTQMLYQVQNQWHLQY